MTKAEELFRKIRGRLENGEFSINSRFPSESDLADFYKVNSKTVNQAITMLCATGLLRRGVRGSGTTVLKQHLLPRGYIAFIGKFSFYNARILNGIQRTALSRGYAPITIFGDNASAKRQLEQLADPKLIGIIAAGFVAELFTESSLPLVIVDHDPTPTDSQKLFVNTDNIRGSYELMREIIRRGHQQIAIYCGAGQFRDRTSRVKGFTDAMREAGIFVAENIFHGDETNPADAEQILKCILARSPRPTIIACDSDGSAQSLLTAAARCRVRIPEDIALTAYGHTLFAPLASVEQFPEKIGSLASAKVIALVENGSSSSPEIERVIPQVVNSEFIPDLTIPKGI